jgi:hypothetical protein
MMKPDFVFCMIAVFSSSSFGQDIGRLFGAGVKVSTLGIGIEATTSVTRRSNIRGSFNFFDYNSTWHSNGIDYAGDVRLGSVQITFDQYLTGIFHVSPGLLLYNGNRGSGGASVPAGRSFLLANTTFFSNTTDPVGGTATLDVRNIAPVVLLGIGNRLPRSGKRFGINFEAGVAFQGSPDVQITLTGTACTVNATTACVNAATDPTVQSSVQREEERLKEDLKAVRYYPVVSVGISWKF